MKLSPQFIRFCIVGLVNTAIDTIIFVTLRELGLSVLLANIISTTIGLAVSLALNYRYTFKTTGGLAPPKIALYIGVTLFGLWILQPIAISLLMVLDQHVPYVQWAAGLVGHESILSNAIPKLGSVVVTLTWNYLWYSYVIFKDRKVAAETAIAQE
ncbi:MAG: hypothetical protein JWM37_714 [Candidatus Saccharibacteria bacterium]|nr:hypothetical protein [Candidatus Saccharibacteria bacterium]